MCRNKNFVEDDLGDDYIEKELTFRKFLIYPERQHITIIKKSDLNRFGYRSVSVTIDYDECRFVMVTNTGQLITKASSFNDILLEFLNIHENDTFLIVGALGYNPKELIDDLDNDPNYWFSENKQHESEFNFKSTISSKEKLDILADVASFCADETDKILPAQVPESIGTLYRLLSSQLNESAEQVDTEVIQAEKMQWIRLGIFSSLMEYTSKISNRPNFNQVVKPCLDVLKIVLHNSSAACEKFYHSIWGNYQSRFSSENTFIVTFLISELIYIPQLKQVFNQETGVDRLLAIFNACSLSQINDGDTQPQSTCLKPSIRSANCMGLSHHLESLLPVINCEVIKYFPICKSPPESPNKNAFSLTSPVNSADLKNSSQHKAPIISNTSITRRNRLHSIVVTPNKRSGLAPKQSLDTDKIPQKKEHVILRRRSTHLSQKPLKLNLKPIVPNLNLNALDLEKDFFSTRSTRRASMSIQSSNTRIDSTFSKVKSNLEVLSELAELIGQTLVATDLTALLSYKQFSDARANRRLMRTEKKDKNEGLDFKPKPEPGKVLYQTKCNILKILTAISQEKKFPQFSRSLTNVIYTELINIHNDCIPYKKSYSKLLYQTLQPTAEYVEIFYSRFWNSRTKGISTERLLRHRRRLDLFVWRLQNQMKYCIKTYRLNEIITHMNILADYLSNCTSRVISSQVVDTCMETLILIKSCIFLIKSDKDNIVVAHLVYLILKIFDAIANQSHFLPLNDMLFLIWIDDRYTWEYVKSFTGLVLKDTIFQESIISSFRDGYEFLYKVKCQVIDHYTTLLTMIRSKYQVDNVNLARLLNREEEQALLVKKFEFLLYPSSSLIHNCLQEGNQYTDFNLKKGMLHFLHNLLSFNGSHYLTDKNYINSLISFHYMQFLKLYNNYTLDVPTIDLCRGHLKILTDLARQNNQTVTLKFYQLRAVDFLAREMNLEYEIKVKRKKLLLEMTPHTVRHKRKELGQNRMVDQPVMTEVDSTLSDDVYRSKHKSTPSNKVLLISEKSNRSSSLDILNKRELSPSNLSDSSRGFFNIFKLTRNKYSSKNMNIFSKNESNTHNKTSLDDKAKKSPKNFQFELKRDGSDRVSIPKLRLDHIYDQGQTGDYSNSLRRNKSLTEINSSHTNCISMVNPIQNNNNYAAVLREKKMQGPTCVSSSSFTTKNVAFDASASKIHSSLKHMELKAKPSNSFNFGIIKSVSYNQKGNDLNANHHENITLNHPSPLIPSQINTTARSNNDIGPKSPVYSTKDVESPFCPRVDSTSQNRLKATLLSTKGSTNAQTPSQAIQFQKAEPSFDGGDHAITPSLAQTNVLNDKRKVNAPSAIHIPRLNFNKPDPSQGRNPSLFPDLAAIHRKNIKPDANHVDKHSVKETGDIHNPSLSTTMKNLKGPSAKHHHGLTMISNSTDQLPNRLNRPLNHDRQYSPLPDCKDYRLDAASHIDVDHNKSFTLRFHMLKMQHVLDELELRQTESVDEENVVEADPFHFARFEENLYYSERDDHKLYSSEKLHQKFLELLFLLMLDSDQQSLEPLYIERYNVLNRKINIPFILWMHVNHPANYSVLGPLSHSVEKISQSTFRLLKLLSTRFFDVSLYKDLTPLATGAYGSVYTCKLFEEEVVAKLMQLPKNVADRCVLHDIFTEIFILEQWSSDDRICKMIDYGIDDEHYWIVMKKYPMNLREWRLHQSSLEDSLQLYLNIYWDVLKTCTFLVENHVNHYDIKCDNFLINPYDPDATLTDIYERAGRTEKSVKFFDTHLDGSDMPHFTVCLGDFGESLVYSNKSDGYTTDNRGTEFIKSPEMLRIAYAKQTQHKAYDRRKKIGANKASDIWSLGCLLYELLTGEFMFYSDDWSRFWMVLTSPNEELINEGHRKKCQYNTHLINFFQWILVRDPAYRPTLYDVIQRFSQVRKDILSELKAKKSSKVPHSDDKQDVPDHIISVSTTPISPTFHPSRKNRLSMNVSSEKIRRNIDSNMSGNYSSPSNLPLTDRGGSTRTPVDISYKRVSFFPTYNPKFPTNPSLGPECFLGTMRMVDSSDNAFKEKRGRPSSSTMTSKSHTTDFARQFPTHRKVNASRDPTESKWIQDKNVKSSNSSSIGELPSHHSSSFLPWVKGYNSQAINVTDTMKITGSIDFNPAAGLSSPVGHFNQQIKFPPSFISQYSSFTLQMTYILPKDKHDVTFGESCLPSPRQLYPHELAFFNHTISCITSYLYLGSYQSLKDKTKLKVKYNITHVLNCTKYPNIHSEHFDYLTINMANYTSTPIQEMFSRIIQFIHAAVKSCGRVLVIGEGISDKMDAALNISVHRNSLKAITNQTNNLIGRDLQVPNSNRESLAATIVIAILMAGKHMSFFQAFKYVIERRYWTQISLQSVQMIYDWDRMNGRGPSPCKCYACLCALNWIVVLYPIDWFQPERDLLCNCKYNKKSDCPIQGCNYYVQQLQKMDRKDTALRWEYLDLNHITYQMNGIEEFDWTENASDLSNRIRGTKKWQTFRCKVCHFVTHAIHQVDERLWAIVTNNSSNLY